jgi:hypothetical protein
MKKILVLLITAFLIFGCEKNEPYKNDYSSNNSNSSVNNQVDNNSELPSTPKIEDGYLRIYNQSLSNTYQCYVNDICIATVPPQKDYLYTAYNSGGHTLHIKVVLNGESVPDGPATKSVTLKKGVINSLKIPELANLYIKNSSSDDYTVTINDGLFEFVLRPNQTYTVENLDLYARYKIYVVQKNGYLFYPTKETYYYTMTDLMQNVISFNQ